MRIIFNDDTLYVDIVGNIGALEMNIIKSRVFSILNQYEVDNIVVNFKEVFNLNKKTISNFIEEYHKKYNGKISVID